MNAKGAVEMVHAFAHAGDADAVWNEGSAGFVVLGNADAVVANIERHQAVGLGDADECILGAGVAMNVGERFLDDAEYGYFDFARHAGEAPGAFECDAETGTFGERADVTAERGAKAGLFEQRRME